MNGTLRLPVVRLPHSTGLDLPSYASQAAAGMDLRAAIDAHGPMTLEPGDRQLIPTGLIFEIPEGYEGQIRPRSGLAFKHGISIPNSPGTIDSDYRGEVMVLLINLGKVPFVVNRGERIAQLIVAPVVRADIVETELANETDRGAGGFGSTGSQ